MQVEDIIKSVAVQGSLLDLDTDLYQNIISESRRSAVPQDDVLSRIISNIVRLCESGAVDPWYIDINGISRILSSMIDENFSDFAQAGYLMWQAWHILFKKSEKLISDADWKRTVESEEVDFSADTLDPVYTDVEITGINGSPVIGVREPVQHRERRRILMVELLEAIRKAYYFKRDRKDPVQIVEAPREIDIDGIVNNLNAEEPEREIEKLRADIMSLNLERFSFRELTFASNMDPPAIFLYLMFLARNHIVKLSQESAYGEIWIALV